MYHLGDVLETFFMDLKFSGLYRSWQFHTTRLATDKPSMPLTESTFCHFVALEVCFWCYDIFNLHFFLRLMKKNVGITEESKWTRGKLQKSQRIVYTTITNIIIYEWDSRFSTNQAAIWEKKSLNFFNSQIRLLALINKFKFVMLILKVRPHRARYFLH